MADVRSLLRNERAQRRITHPNATYSATGSLECGVCHIPLKSDQEVWNKHLKSTQHAMRAERLRISKSTSLTPLATREVSNSSKKRKASDGGDHSRKRTKPIVDVPGGFFDGMIETNNAPTETIVGHYKDVPEISDAPTNTTAPTIVLPSHPLPTPPIPAQVDEDEWAAFERDVATPPPDPSLRASALTAGATIVAAPMTAAELAAQAREEAYTESKERREAELEGEKEDAARALEEEFDQMEDLEERVRKLREKREELRGKRAQESGGEGREAGGVDEGGGGGEVEEDKDSEEDDEEDDLWGDWGW